ncbi:hypothetical protein FHX48_001365 [Microbacterium halimionae]|uniref:Uncharacterized protein n=1 Tax=Microbacterium halimionae TaxID=1526413 RepID=A0A7W3JNV2_9MICO|nr:hypothetical protein [Microbacterium halimionae]MBA8816292.1 hypothetical protein [Microbacterium halimionae]NII96495.1 hypothetical protein [Microbacterium halimionae]
MTNEERDAAVPTDDVTQAGEQSAEAPTSAAPAEAAAPGEVTDTAIAEEAVAEYAEAEEPTSAPVAASTPSVDDVQYGVGPFSVREIALTSVWFVAFIVSFFSVASVGFNSVWTSGLSWILTIGLPTLAVILIVMRRLSPEGIRRVGSLGIDQFASVAFSVSAMLWLQMVWDSVSFAVQGGPMLHSWVAWVELVLMAGGVVLTVFAPFLPTLKEDFAGRPEAPAHRNARAVRKIIARPRPEPRPAPAPVYAAPAAVSEPSNEAVTDAYAPDAFTSLSSESPSNEAAPAAEDLTTTVQPTAHQAFWALSPVERDVLDVQGNPIFSVGPTAWALVIEDRGEVFVVRHEDGRVGFLHDVSGITRG